MGIALQLREAIRRRPGRRSKKSKAPSQGRQILLAAATKAGAEVNNPEDLDGMIENEITSQVYAALEKIHQKARAFKITRTDDISDDESVDYGNDEEILYFARVESPAEVKNTVKISINPRVFASELAQELGSEISPSSTAMKIASDRDVLAFAGTQALQNILKVWDKQYSDPPSEESDFADRAKEFAFQNAEDVRMSADEKMPEIMHVANLELRVISIKEKLSFASPWKFVTETTFNMKGSFDWFDYD